MHLNNTLTLIAGPKGSGKTYLAAGKFGKEERAVCWNSAYDVEFTARSTDHFAGGASEAAKMWAVLKNPQLKFRLEFIPRDFTYNQARTRLSAASLDEVCGMCMDAKNLTFYFDEAHKLLGAGYAPPHFLNILQEGRHAQVSVTLISHRMARIPKDFTQEIDEWYLFQTAEPRDLEDIMERCGERVAHRVLHLRRLDLTGENAVPGQYYYYNSTTRIGKVTEAGTGKVVAIDDLGLVQREIW